MDLSELVAGKGAATRYALLAGVSALAFGAAGPAQAGNILLTGHDNDFHCGGGGPSGGFPSGGWLPIPRT